jgi:hypothetical protein
MATKPKASKGGARAPAAGAAASSRTNAATAAQPRVRAPRKLCKSNACRRTHFGPVAVCKSIAHDLGGQSLSLLHIRRPIPFALACVRRSDRHATLPHMAPKKTTLKELGEMIAHVVKHMATKDDIADVERDIADVKSTLADHTKILNDHTRDLAIIKHDVTNNLDKRLQLEVRVTTIEKHLGLDKKITA